MESSISQCASDFEIICKLLKNFRNNEDVLSYTLTYSKEKGSKGIVRYDSKLIEEKIRKKLSTNL